MDQPLVELTPEERMPVRWWPQAAALLLIALELGWVVPWRQSLAGIGSPQPIWKAWVALGGVMAAAYALAFAAEALRLVRRARLVLLAALLVVSLAVTKIVLHPGSVMNPDTEGIMLFDLGFLATMGFTLWLWQRGVALGSETVRPPLAWRRFQVGLAALILHTFAATYWGLPTVGLGGLTAYLFIGLLAVTLARISYVSLTRSARKSPFDRRWIATTGGVLAAAILLAAALGGLLTGQGRDLLEGLRTLLGYLTIALVFILSLPVLLLSYLLLPLAPLLQQLINRPAPTPLATPVSGSPYPFLIEEPAALRPLPLALQTACLWMALAVIVVVVFLRVRQRMNEQGVLIVEGPQSLLSEGDAARLARQAFQDFLDGIARRLRPQERAAAAQRVRQIYTALLDLSAALNHNRPASATPLEFLTALSAVFPGYNADLEAITHAYMRVRYGEYPESLAEVQALETAWLRLQAYGERARKNGARASSA
jgi:hypothetical protein